MPNRTRGVVLLVEDDRNMSMLVGEWLERHHYEIDFAEDGIDALNLARDNPYDAIVLDVALPRLTGVETCRRMRTDGVNTGTPMLMVTARDTLQDKLDGLAAGADDYMTKPFFPAELEARITALVRRRRAEVAPALLEVGDLRLDPRSGLVTRGGVPVDLTPTGFRILQILMRDAPRVVSRSQLEQELWGLETPDSDALRSHLYVLRKAIDRGHDIRLLHTLPNVGYRMLPIAATALDAARRQRRRERRERGSADADARAATEALPAFIAAS